VRASDAALARVIDTVGPFRMQLKKTPSIFAALAEAIVYQQLHAKAASTIFARVCALFPRAHEGPTAEQILRASDEQLRSAGLSRAKLLWLKDLARKAKGGAIPTLAEVHRMADDEIIGKLTGVRGIGRWTVEMLLIFRLGRPDVLPADDFGIRKGFAITYRKRELPAPKHLEAHGARWKPYRTVASWYLWRAAERAAK
jgi:3-methyladenine DNA glycosylase/8-oxoguanine DNA glycosylase